MKTPTTATAALGLPSSTTDASRTHGRRRLRMVMLALSVIGGSVGFAAQAEAGTVLNRFERSCYWGCSPYRQTNGAYNPAFGSTCVTKSWSGTSSYYNPPGWPCR